MSNEVLIKIEASGINRLDHYIREGGVNPELSFLFTLGADAVGHIVELGADVMKFKLGERVIPMPGYPIDPSDDGHEVLATSRSYAIRRLVENGAYAQYMVMPEKWLLKETTGLPAEQLAGLPMPLVTGVRAIKEVGGDSLATSIEWVKPLGIVVLMGNVLGLESTIPVRSVFFPQKQVRGTLMGSVSDLEWGLEQVKNGNIKPRVDTVFNPEQAVEAHQYLADGKALGLTVFKF